jgi:CRP/FNR family cyclic AMP-dependent transcriptional regulator
MGQQARVIRYLDGETIFSQNSEPDAMYIVRDGKVRIFREGDRGDTTLATLNKGEIFGEMALLNHTRRSASAQAIGKVAVEPVTKEELDKLSADPLVRELLQSLSARLREMDEGVEKASAASTAVREGLSHVHLVRHWFV